MGEGEQEMKAEGRGKERREEGGEEKKSQPWRTQSKAQKKPVTPPDSI